jgi:hypothetical protein
MLTNGELWAALEATSRRFRDLKKQFEEFAMSVQGHLMDQESPLKPLKVTYAKDANHFEIAFADRTFDFVFSLTTPAGQKSVVGSVQAYSKVDIPEKKITHIGGFTFRPNGEADMKYGTDPIYITAPTGGSYLVLHFLNEGFSK